MPYNGSAIMGMVCLDGPMEEEYVPDYYVSYILQTSFNS